MTKTSIPQNCGKVKETRCISNLRQKKDIAGYTAIEILLDTNELASDILATNGFTLMTEYFAKCEDVWKFYGVSERYFAGILQRNWISSRSTPDDIHKNQHGDIMISARMVLALSAIMYQGRNIPENSKVMRVYKNLQGTRYYSKAEEHIKVIEESTREKTDKHLKAVSFVEKAFSNSVDTFEITPDGRVMVSISGLAKLIDFVSGTGVLEESIGKNTTDNKNFPRSIAVVASKDGVEERFNSMTECAKHIGSTAGRVSAVACVPNRTVNGYSISYA